MSKNIKLQRIKQQLAVTPNVKAATVAKHLGITTDYAYNLMSVARKSLGMVKHRDGGWKLKERMQTAAVVTTNKPATQESNSPRIVEAHYPVADNVNHPAHYKVGGIETIDFIEAKELGYNLGNVVKYITRAGHKADLREDLLKARWYLNREISKLDNAEK